MARYTVVLGDEWMALYRDNLKVKEGVRLAFGDILDGCWIEYEVMEAEEGWLKDRAEKGVLGERGMPERLTQVPRKPSIPLSE